MESIGPKLLLFGGTDLTLSVAEYLYETGMLSGIAAVSREISHLKSSTKKNCRYVDLKEWSATRNIPYVTYVNSDSILEFLAAYKFSLAIVAGFHYYLPPKVIRLFDSGVFAFHASLLPNLKGWSPLNWAILLRKEVTGVTLFKMNQDIDGGEIYIQSSFNIKDLYIRDVIALAEKHILKMLKEFVADCLAGNLISKLKPQSIREESFALQRCEEDAKINWSASANEIIALVRASSKPYFGAFTFIGGRKIRIWQAQTSNVIVYGRIGQIFRFSKSMPIHILCGNGVIKILEYSIEDLSQEESVLFLEKHLNLAFS